MTDDMGLDEDMGFFRIQSAGNVLSETGEGISSKFGGHAGHGDGVHVDDAKIALMIILHARPVSNRPEIVAQGKPTRGLSAG